MRDITYPPVIVAAKTTFRLLGLRFQLAGTHHIPISGPALLAVNHVSYLDFVFSGLAAQPSHRLVRFMAKREIFENPVAGPIMRSLHHISVDRGAGIGSYHEAVRVLGLGEIVGVFPEATVSRSFEIKELKTGAARMAASAGVPLIPVVVWGTQRILTKDHRPDLSRGKTIAISVGAPLSPKGVDPVADTAELHTAMRELLDTTIKAYPAQEQPPGCWWLPRSHGGSAPTPEEAKVLELAEKARKAERRAAKAKAKAKANKVSKGGRFSKAKS